MDTTEFYSVAICIILLVTSAVWLLFKRVDKSVTTEKSSQSMSVSPQKLTTNLSSLNVSDLSFCRGVNPTLFQKISAASCTRDRLGFKPDQILISANGEVYDVTSHPTGRQFYGPGNTYHVFAGCDSSIALAKMDVNSALCNKWDGWEELTTTEKKILADWITRFRLKYRFVGHLKEAAGCRLDLTDFNCPPY